MTFIEDLKNTLYYRNLIINSKVIMLYLGGSYCNGTHSSNSDYDLIAIVDDPKSIDVSETMYLNYKGRKVHWYYWSLKDFLSCKLNDLWIVGSVYFRNITEDLIIYKNIEYLPLINTILNKKFELSKLAIYKFFDSRKIEINSILNQIDRGLLKSFSKIVYHLCIAIYYLTETPLDRDILLTIKKLDYQPDANTKQVIREYLATGLAYLKEFPVDYRKELSKLYDNLSKQI